MDQPLPPCPSVADDQNQHEGQQGSFTRGVANAALLSAGAWIGLFYLLLLR